MFKSLFYSIKLTSIMLGGVGDSAGVLFCIVLFPLLIPLVEDRGEKLKLPSPPPPGILCEFGVTLSSADLSVLSII